MFVFGFEKLVVWQEAKRFALSVYKITTEFPELEKFGLSSQLRRASVSVCSNLAESTAYKSYKNQARFTTIAFGSAIELLNQLILANELGYIGKTDYEEIRTQLETITNKINSLRNFQLKQHHINEKRIDKKRVSKRP